MSGLDQLVWLAVTGASRHGGGMDWFFLGEHTVNVIILVLVLGYFLRTPLRNFFLERRGLIAASMEEAQERLAASRKRYEEYKGKLEAIDDAIASLEEKMRREARVESDEILNAAREGARRIEADTKLTIEAEREKTIRAVRGEFASQVVERSVEVIRRNITEADNARFVDEFLEKARQEASWLR